MWLLLSLHVVALFLEGAVLALIRRDARLFRDIYLNIPAALAVRRSQLREERERTQSTRRIDTSKYLRAFQRLPQKLKLLRRHGFPQVR